MKTWYVRVRGSLLATVGYLLSPLSFWNDLFINIPLAYVFALPFGLIARSLFLPMMILGYWLTNVAGFVLMHKGAKDVVGGERVRYARRDLMKDLALSLLYTAVVALAAMLGWLRLPMEYFS